MHPVLISIGPLKVYAFGFMLALSFLFAIVISTRRAKKFGLDPQHLLDLSVYVIVAGVLGARLLYVVFHLNEYESIIDVFALWQGGATLYGGILLAIFASVWFARRKKINFLLLVDVIAPSLALGIMLTRVGCFMSGCCYGEATDLPWGVTFPLDSAAGYYCQQLAATAGHPVSLHPTQLYASLYALAILVFLLLGEKWFAKRGTTFGAMLFFYGVFRFALDFFRYYESNMRVLGSLTLNQLISIGFVLIALFLFFRKTDARTVRVPAGAAPSSRSKKKSSKKK